MKKISKKIIVAFLVLIFFSELIGYTLGKLNIILQGVSDHVTVFADENIGYWLGLIEKYDADVYASLWRDEEHLFINRERNCEKYPKLKKNTKLDKITPSPKEILFSKFNAIDPIRTIVSK